MKKILSIFLSLMMLASCMVSFAEDIPAEEPVKALALVSSTPAHATDDSTAKYASFTFNNDISSAEVLINGEEASCTVDGKTVTADDELEMFSDYSAQINVTDIHGQSISEKIYFSTSGSAGKTITSSEGNSWHVNINGSASMTTMMNIKYNNSSNFVFYRIPVPVIEYGQNLESYVITCHTYAGANVYTMKFAGDDWDGTTMKTTDEAVAVVFNDVSKKWNNSQYNAADSVKSTDLGGKMYEIKVDITSYVKECMDAGEEYVDIGFVSNSTINLFGFYAKDNGYKKYQAAYSYYVSEPRFEICDVSTVVSGTVLESASFAILTDVEDISQVVEIRALSGDSVDAGFVYDETNGKYVLEQPVDLVEDTEYEFVFKADSVDNYGNTNFDEKILAKFYASADDYEAVTKTELSEEEVFYSSVNAENSTISVFYKKPYYSSSNVDVSIVNTESGETAFFETVKSGKRGTVYLKDISLPESGSYELKIYPRNASYCLEKDFSFVSAEDTLHLWDTIASGGTSADISAEWNEISDLFGFENGYFEDIADMNGFFNKVEANRDSSISEMNTENIALMRTFVKNMSFFTAVEQAKDASKLIELLNSELFLIKSQDKEIHDLWVECSESKYAQKTADALIDIIESVSSAEELIALMDEAFDVYKVEIILDLIEEADHSSEITDIILGEGNAELLGIEEYIADYEAIESKTAINESLMTGFDSAKDFAEFFAEALKEAPETEDDPPSSPSSNKGSSGKGSKGKGSSGKGGSTQFVSSAPVVQAPFSPFTDTDSVSWAKDHITKLYNKGVINGKSQNKFAPNDTITREEITKLLVTLGKFQPAEGNTGFDDVAPGSWYEEYVSIAVSNGIVNGMGNSRFGTGMKATRQDIAVMIVNMLTKLGATVEEGKISFADGEQISDYAKNPVAFLASKGILTGDTFGNFNPKANATRAEVAVMLSRVCDVFVKEVK